MKGRGPRYLKTASSFAITSTSATWPAPTCWRWRVTRQTSRCSTSAAAAGTRSWNSRASSRIAGREVEPDISGEYRVGDTRHSVSDIAKLQRLGWQPTKTPRDSVRDYVEWIRRQKLDQDYAAEALAKLREMGALRKCHLSQRWKRAPYLRSSFPPTTSRSGSSVSCRGSSSFCSRRGSRFEIVVVNDGSQDDTALVARELSQDVSDDTVDRSRPESRKGRRQ